MGKNKFMDLEFRLIECLMGKMNLLQPRTDREALVEEALRQLFARKEFPENRISLLCVKKNEAALKHLSFLDEIIVLDNLDSLAKNLFSLLCIN